MVWSPEFNSHTTKLSYLLLTAVVLLLAGNSCYTLAFVTDHWVVVEFTFRETAQHSNSSLHESHDITAKLNFGLWESCDLAGACLGTVWPPYFNMVRGVAIATLFGHVICTCLLVGQLAERWLDKDLTTLMAVVVYGTLNSLFTIFMMLVFYVKWGWDFADWFMNEAYFECLESRTTIHYSFYLALSCAVVTLLASGAVGLEVLVTRSEKWRKCLESLIRNNLMDEIRLQLSEFNV